MAAVAFGQATVAGSALVVSSGECNLKSSALYIQNYLVVSPRTALFTAIIISKVLERKTLVHLP